MFRLVDLIVIAGAMVLGSMVAKFVLQALDYGVAFQFGGAALIASSVAMVAWLVWSLIKLIGS